MTEELILEFYDAFTLAAPDFEAAGVTPVKTLDRYRGQPSNPKEFEYYPLPAVFISATTIWTKVGNVYNGDTSFEFHIETESTGQTANLYDDKEEGLKYHRFINQCRKVLDNMSSERISTPIRTTDKEIDTGVTIYVSLGYMATYYEDEDQGQYTEGRIEGIDLRGSLVRTLKR